MEVGSYYTRIAAFLSQYIRPGGDPVEPNVYDIIPAIRILIRSGCFKKEEMRKKALEEWDVIIPSDFFPEEDGR